MNITTIQDSIVIILVLMSRYLSTSSLDIGGVRDGNIISSLDICLFSISTVMILVNILLLVSSIREIPCQTLPWLCANIVVIVIAMVSWCWWNVKTLLSRITHNMYKWKHRSF